MMFYSFLIHLFIHSFIKKIGENIKELFQQLGDWCFLHQDQGLKEFLPTNVKKAQKN